MHSYGKIHAMQRLKKVTIYIGLHQLQTHNYTVNGKTSKQ